jgi:hypothetical protein
LSNSALEGRVERVLAADVRHHLRTLVGEGVVACELRDYGVLQLVGAADGGVLRHPALEGLLGRGLDVGGGVEVGLARGEVDDVAPLLAQRRGLGRHGERRRWLHDGQP